VLRSKIDLRSRDTKNAAITTNLHSDDKNTLKMIFTFNSFEEVKFKTCANIDFLITSVRVVMTLVVQLDINTPDLLHLIRSVICESWLTVPLHKYTHAQKPLFLNYDS